MNWFKYFSFAVLVLIFCIIGNSNFSKTVKRNIASDCSSLEEKLINQFNLYENARLSAMTTGSIFSRSQWEDKLAPDKNCDFSPKDIAKLQSMHKKIIDENHKLAVKNSLIKTKFIKSKKLEAKFCQELPKGGVLHLHPSGVIDNQTLKELGVRDTSPFFLSHSQHSFSDFDRIFSPLRGLLGSGLTPNQKYVIKKYLERAKKEKVIYVEFSKLFTPSLSEDAVLSNWSKEFFDETGIIVKWKNGFIRAWDETSLRSQFNSLIESEYKFRKKTGLDQFPDLVGIDLYGNENSGTMLEKGQHLYSQLFAMRNNQHYKGWSSKLYMTAHAGELGDPRNSRDAMIFGVDRIGHGVLLADQPVNLEYARIYNNGKGLPIEINLHSNYILSSVDSYENHPFLTFLRLNLPVSFSTDDEGIFQSTISTECELALKYTNIEYSELKQMSYNSIHTSFTDEETKGHLLSTLDKMFDEFEKKWTNI